MSRSIREFWQRRAYALFAVAALVVAGLLTTPTQAIAVGRGCYCYGWECGDPSQQWFRWCCDPWGSSNCGCTLYVVNCQDCGPNQC